MTEAEREQLTRELADLSGGGNRNPVLNLLERIEVDAVKALVACCDQYFNAELRSAAASLAEGGLPRIFDLLGGVSASIRDADPGLFFEVERCNQAAAMVLRATEADDSEEQAADALLVFLSTVECLRTEPRGGKRRQDPLTDAMTLFMGRQPLVRPPERADLRKVISARLDERLASIGVARHHDRESTLMGTTRGRRWLLHWLQGCAATARKASYAIASQSDTLSLWLAALRLYAPKVDAFDAQIELVFGGELVHQVEHIARSVVDAEVDLLSEGAAFPAAYASPFGAMHALDASRVSDTHSYFASRVALLALALQAGPLQTQSAKALSPDDFGISVVHCLWSPHDTGDYSCAYADGIGFARRTLEADYDAQSPQRQLWQVLLEACGAREYDVASDWRKEAGRHGSLARTAQWMSSVSLGDLRRITAVGKILLSSPRTVVADSSVLAIVMKLACLLRGIVEPSPSWGIRSCPVPKYLNAASHQIHAAQQLIVALRPSLRGEPRLIRMSRNVYFVDPEATVPREGYEWPRTTIAWRSLKSWSHLETGNPGPHLWLYGRPYQELVDEVIASQATAAESPEASTWQRLVRFIFLVPYVRTHGLRSRLGDWDLHGPGSTDYQLKTSLRHLCISVQVPGLDLERDVLGLFSASSMDRSHLLFVVPSGQTP